MPDLVSFNRNRNTQIMGGVATLVNMKDKDYFEIKSVWIFDGEYLCGRRHLGFSATMCKIATTEYLKTKENITKNKTYDSALRKR